MTYNYMDAIKIDVLDYIMENDLKLESSVRMFKDALYDDLFCEDCVTGNASGSYTFNTYQARENLEGNEDLLAEALAEFGRADNLEEALLDPEAADVTIRCYLLGRAIEEVVDDLVDEGDLTEDDEDEDEDEYEED